MQNFTQYIPLSIYNLQTWMGVPSIYVLDCSAAATIIHHFQQFAEQREHEVQPPSTPGTEGCAPPRAAPRRATLQAAMPLYTHAHVAFLHACILGWRSTCGGWCTSVGLCHSAVRRVGSFKDCILLGACEAHQILPQNPELPADLFTACLTTPIKIALHWYTTPVPQHPLFFHSR
jgi:regulator-associated protein of mTOR